MLRLSPRGIQSGRLGLSIRFGYLAAQPGSVGNAVEERDLDKMAEFQPSGGEALTKSII